MPRLSDNQPHSVYRINARAARFGRILAGSGIRIPRDVTVVAVDVMASSPSVAADWVLSYPHLAGLPANADVTEITHAYKLRRQPKVWLRRSGTRGYRFNVRRRETAPLAETLRENFAVINTTAAFFVALLAVAGGIALGLLVTLELLLLLISTYLAVWCVLHLTTRALRRPAPAPVPDDTEGND
jgi:hypothetical protein